MGINLKQAIYADLDAHPVSTSGLFILITLMPTLMRIPCRLQGGASTERRDVRAQVPDRSRRGMLRPPRPGAPQDHRGRRDRRDRRFEPRVPMSDLFLGSGVLDRASSADQSSPSDSVPHCTRNPDLLCPTCIL